MKGHKGVTESNLYVRRISKVSPPVHIRARTTIFL